MRPSALTNEEEPVGARAEESRTWSSHSCEGENPYVAWTLSLGKASKSHIPSSAKAGRHSRIEQRSRTAFFMMAPVRVRVLRVSDERLADCVSKPLTINSCTFVGQYSASFWDG